MTATIVSNAASKQCRRRVPESGREVGAFEGVRRFVSCPFALVPVSRNFHNLRPRRGLQTDLSAFRHGTNNVSPSSFFPRFVFPSRFEKLRDIHERKRQKKNDPRTSPHVEPASRKYPSIKMILSPFETKQTCRSSHEIKSRRAIIANK